MSSKTAKHNYRPATTGKRCRFCSGRDEWNDKCSAVNGEVELDAVCDQFRKINRYSKYLEK